VDDVSIKKVSVLKHKLQGPHLLVELGVMKEGGLNQFLIEAEKDQCKSIILGERYSNLGT